MTSTGRDSLGDRMKAYERAFDLSLPARMPLVVRVDGKAFHSYTRALRRPWDERLASLMDDVAAMLCREMQGARLAYVQSDEISVLLVDYAGIDTQAWMRGRLQKIASVAAGLASAWFTAWSGRLWPDGERVPASFDARAFVLPREDVHNYFVWRQQDATRNSVQALARSIYSHRDCTDRDGAALQEMCFQAGHNWNDLPIPQRRGRCIVRRASVRSQPHPITNEVVSVERHEWVVDNEIPVFSQDPAYVRAWVAP
jgi:tRNA(His) guanylyltransferase